MRSVGSAALGAASVAFAFTLAAACGAPKAPPKSPDDLPSTTGDGGTGTGGGASVDAGASSVCAGASLDLANVLVQSACEVPNAAADAKRRDVSALLDVKVDTSTATVAPGGHVDLVVTFTNKSSSPLPLDFLLDPTARFTVEAYAAPNKRADLPKSKPPHVKGEVGPAEPSAPGTAEISIAAGGKATVKVGWDAVRLKWAPELVKGTPPEQGYPTSPAGPLAKGTYTLRVVTPLIGVSEGAEREVSTVKTTITVH
jgi:hypothetical protein